MIFCAFTSGWLLEESNWKDCRQQAAQWHDSCSHTSSDDCCLLHLHFHHRFPTKSLKIVSSTNRFGKFGHNLFPTSASEICLVRNLRFERVFQLTLHYRAASPPLFPHILSQLIPETYLDFKLKALHFANLRTLVQMIDCWKHSIRPYFRAILHSRILYSWAIIP